MNSRPKSNATILWIERNIDTAKSIPQMEREAAKARFAADSNQTKTKNPQAATA